MGFVSFLKNKVGMAIFPALDALFTRIDKTHLRRTKSLSFVPNYKFRRGGKVSYVEWGHVIGIFQSLIYENLQGETAPQILDVGCGTGLLGISAAPYLHEGGHYTGLDVIKQDVDYCKRSYPASLYSFQHLDLNNPTYANQQLNKEIPWGLPSDTFDLVMALSVWTHFNETDAKFYLKEVSRVLKTGKRAIITFFYLDEPAQAFIKEAPETSPYYPTPTRTWLYTESSYGSDNWRHPVWVEHPEDAIAVTPQGMEELTQIAGLSIAKYYSGLWKNKEGLYFQDVFVFEKT